MTNIPAAARLLADAFLQTRKIDALPEDARPDSYNTAYAIQDETLKQVGIDLAGWKLSVPTAAAQKKIGIDGPLVGPLLKRRIVEDGQSLSVDHFNFPNIEAEIAFVIGTTPPANATVETIKNHIASAHMVIEIADRRFVEKQHPMVTLCDLNSTGYLVVGPEVTDWRENGFARTSVETRCDGQRLAFNDDAQTWPDPLAGLVYLIGFLAKKGLSLKPGDIVTTGAYATPTLVDHGHVEAEFQGLSTVGFTISR